MIDTVPQHQVTHLLMDSTDIHPCIHQFRGRNMAWRMATLPDFHSVVDGLLPCVVCSSCRHLGCKLGSSKVLDAEGDGVQRVKGQMVLS